MAMTPDRWAYTSAYLTDVFGPDDEELKALRRDAEAAGLPPIAITADVGALLTLLVRLTRGRCAVEVGTLGGYSAAFIARGLAAGGQLVTVERSDACADFAERGLATLGLGDRVTVRRGTALEVLPELVATLGPGSVDFVFLDAEKSEYSAYLDALLPALAPGALVVADNVLGSGTWWIDDEDNATRQAIDGFNRRLAAHPAFEVACVPIREGVLVARHAG